MLTLYRAIVSCWEVCEESHIFLNPIAWKVDHFKFAINILRETTEETSHPIRVCFFCANLAAVHSSNVMIDIGRRSSDWAWYVINCVTTKKMPIWLRRSQVHGLAWFERLVERGGQHILCCSSTGLPNWSTALTKLWHVGACVDGLPSASLLGQRRESPIYSWIDRQLTVVREVDL